VASSKFHRTKLKRILAYFIDTHPTLTTRLTSLIKGKFVGKKIVVPNFEGTIWIGLSTAIFIGFFDEFLTATDDFWTAVGFSTPSNGMLWLRTFAATLLPSCFICLFFAVFLSKGFYTKASVKSLLLYLEKAWKKIAVADIIFLIVYLPWVWYLGSPLLGFFELLPVGKTTGALIPGFFIENSTPLLREKFQKKPFSMILHGKLWRTCQKIGKRK